VAQNTTNRASDRWPDHQPSRLRGQAADQDAGRGDLRGLRRSADSDGPLPPAERTGMAGCLVTAAYNLVRFTTLARRAAA
jgi:hypothetical protein